MRLFLARLVLLVAMHLALCSLPWFDKPMMLGIMAVMDKKDSMRFFPVSGIACDNAPRAVFSSLVHQPMMLASWPGFSRKTVA